MPGCDRFTTSNKGDRMSEDKRIPNYLGNFYGYHDGYDGSVFKTDHVSKTLVSSVGGIPLILEVTKIETNKRDKETG